MTLRAWTFSGDDFSCATGWDLIVGVDSVRDAGLCRKWNFRGNRDFDGLPSLGVAVAYRSNLNQWSRLRLSLSGSLINGPACSILPFISSVLISDFCPASRFTSVSNVRYPGSSILIRCFPGLISME